MHIPHIILTASITPPSDQSFVEYVYSVLLLIRSMLCAQLFGLCIRCAGESHSQESWTRPYVCAPYDVHQLKYRSLHPVVSVHSACCVPWSKNMVDRRLPCRWQDRPIVVAVAYLFCGSSAQSGSVADAPCFDLYLQCGVFNLREFVFNSRHPDLRRVLGRVRTVAADT